MRDVHLAFAFGVAFLLLLLLAAVTIQEPTAFQLLVFRTALALSAAGIGAVIPGRLVVRFGEGVRAGGALALFCVVFYTNPPQLIVEYKANALVTQGESALSRPSFDLARQLFTRAQTAAPNSWEPTFGLARVAFRTGNYGEAYKQYEHMAEQQEKAGISDAASHAGIEYQMALCLDGSRKYAEELYLLEKIRKEAEPNSYEYISAVFDEGVVNLVLALHKWPELDGDALDKATSALSDSAEIPGQPTEWLHYHQLCVASIQANSPQDQQNIHSSFIHLIEEFRKLPHEIKQQQTALFKLIIDDTYERPPGHPAPCPPLVALLKDKGTKLSEVLP